MKSSFVRRYLWLVVGAVGLWPAARAMAQQAPSGSHIVTGTVTRATGEGIPAATVLITGTTRGTLTDNDGHFKLTVPDAPTQVSVRSIGFLPKTVTIGPTDSKLTVSLLEDPAKLQQVVVTGLATGIQKQASATSTVVVDSEALTKAAAPTVDMALQDKVPGAQIETNSGAPGGGLQVQIRGINTVIGASDPLFVVDGVIYSNATVPSGLYTVSKSGTIAGGSGPSQDDAANRLADLDPNDIQSIQILKSAAASSIYGSKAANGVVIITTKHGASGKPKFDITQRTGFAHLLRGPGERRFTVAGADSLYGAKAVAPFVNNGQLGFYNHLDEVAGQTPIDYETALDVTGGNDNTRYYGSADITADGGIMKNSDATRQSVRANIDQHIAKHIEANFNLNYAHNIEDRGVANNDNSGASVPYALAYIPSFEPMQPGPTGVYPQLPLTYLGANPLQTEQYVLNREEVSRFTGGGRGTYDALSTDKNTLQFVGDAGIDYFNDATNVSAPAFLYFEQSQTQPGVSTIGSGVSQQYNWDLNAIHTYTDPHFKATTSVGTSFEDRILDLNSAATTGLVGTTTYLDNGVSTVPYENNSHERTIALYGDEQFITLNDKLLLDIGVRAERTSADGDADAFFYYPKYAASYQLPHWLGEATNIKLRADYGMTGNQPLFGQKFTLLNTPCISGQCGTAVGGGTGTAEFGNTAIRPETTRETEFGTDITTWNGRADLEVTYFHRITSDLLLPRTPAPSTGYVEVIANGGDFMNEGLEIGGTITPIRTRNFAWTFTTNFQTLHNEVLSLPFPSFVPFGAGFGLAYGEFLVQPGRPITQIIGQTSFNNTGGFNVTEMGQYNPDYRWSFANTFQLPARFNLYMLWDWQKGGIEENQTYSLYSCNGLDPNMGNAGGQQAFQDCSDGIANPFVTSMTFVRLREFRISYDLPIGAARAFFGSEAVSINLSGRNLILWTPYFGYDPEVSNYGQEAITRGIDLAPYPPSRTFLLSVSARF